MSKASRLLKALFVIVVFVTLAGIVYYNRQKYVPTYENALIYFGLEEPCGKPIRYFINDVDNRFAQSEEEFARNIAQAANIWNKAYGKELFKLDQENAPRLPILSNKRLQINLIYDARQEMTNSLNNIKTGIDTSKDYYSQLKQEYDSLKSQYTKQKSELDTLIAKYKTKSPLASEANKIKTATDNLNAVVAKLNAVAGKLNSLGQNINQKIDTYNTVGSSVGREFQEAEYIQDQVGQRINIYQYNDQNKLIRVLAHELGHALGIDHVENKDAIMYPYNSGTSQILAKEDINALQAVCNR